MLKNLGPWPSMVKPMKELMKNKLWRDLKTDKERTEFLRSGQAYETGIIAKAIVEDVAEAFKFRAEHKQEENHVNKTKTGATNGTKG